MSETIVLEVRGGVARITLNRPERLNAFAGRMRDDLHDALDRAAADPEVRVVVITGAGRGFCTGADIEVMGDLLARGDEGAFRRLVEAGMRVIRRLARIEQPVIAAVNGPAAGAGAALALACDLRMASEAASIGLTFNRIGLHPDWGATHTLPRLVGPGRAAELVLSGRMVDAREAAHIGLFEGVVPEAGFPAAVDALASELAAKPPLAVRLAKRSLAEASPGELDAALERERERQLRCFRSADAREGIAAFQERRRPVFTGG